MLRIHKLLLTLAAATAVWAAVLSRLELLGGGARAAVLLVRFLVLVLVLFCRARLHTHERTHTHTRQGGDVHVCALMRGPV